MSFVSRPNRFRATFIFSRRWLKPLLLTFLMIAITNYALFYVLFTVTTGIKNLFKRKCQLPSIQEVPDYPQNIFGNSMLTDDKRRKPSCRSCFNHEFNYVIQNDHICSSMFPGQEIYLLILITTTHRNIEARNAIRDTWLSHSKNNTANVRFVFLLGETQNVVDREDIVRENEIFHDIVKEDFIDNYENLTYKTIMGFKWVSTKCVNAKYVMKTDDDVFVNVPNLINTINGSLKDRLNHTVIGDCLIDDYPIRDINSKWYASYDSYPEDCYPGCCSGTGYVSSLYVITKVYEISPGVPFFHLEDVYVSLCINKLGFHLEDVSGFHQHLMDLEPCVYKGKKYDNFAWPFAGSDEDDMARSMYDTQSTVMLLCLTCCIILQKDQYSIQSDYYLMRS